MRVLILQANPKCAAVKQNFDKVQQALELGAQKKAALVVCPELFLLGYPPRDCLAYPELHTQELEALRKLTHNSKKLGVALLIGHAEKAQGTFGQYYNSASLISEGKTLMTFRKKRLPSYDIFDEHRFFIPWQQVQGPVKFQGKKLGVFICEDAWDQTLAFGNCDSRDYSPQYSPWEDLKDSDLLINLSASPYAQKKRLRRESLFQSKTQELEIPLIYVNCIGAQDDLLFDGASFVCNEKGEITHQAKIFEEENLLVDLDLKSKNKAIPYDHWKELHQALVLSIRDYAYKNSLKTALVGLSGGADSTLVAALACEALGSDNVHGIQMPSNVTSSLSKKLAESFARSLKMSFEEISIVSAAKIMCETLDLETSSIAYENLQARIRGTFLMSRANQKNALLLATCNKSESAMGYTTLYGDMCGTLAPIADLYKTEVYGLSYFMKNVLDCPIPQEVLNRAPTAELAPEQKDSDALPPYAILDTFLLELLENQSLRLKEADWKKFQKEYKLQNLASTVMRMEYKRNQAAPIPKVHQRAFGSGWRFPLSKSTEIFKG